jgi:hypothetical protein
MQESQDPGQGRMRFAAAAAVGVAGLLLAGGCGSSELDPAQQTDRIAAVSPDALERTSDGSVELAEQPSAFDVFDSYMEGFEANTDSDLPPEVQLAYAESDTLKHLADDAVLSGDFDQASDFFEMLAKKSEIAPDGTDYIFDFHGDAMDAFNDSPRDYQVGAIADMVAGNGEFGQAELMIEKLNPKVREYFTNEVDFQKAQAAEDLAREGDLDAADALVETMGDGTWGKDYGTNEVDFQKAQAAEDLAREGDLDAADALVDTMGDGTWGKDYGTRQVDAQR